MKNSKRVMAKGMVDHGVDVVVKRIVLRAEEAEDEESRR
jgi:hypothetical protein